jgi:serine/threonine-protein kinase
MLSPGDPFDRYTVEAIIGQGGMGCVYRAYDPRLGRRVALKVISQGSTSAAANERLLREARAAAAFDHPNSVAIFDVAERSGVPYIVMELVEGRTLRQTLNDASVSVATRVAQLSGVARALAAAHARGLVHRDIKPENVMVRHDGMVKVLDFGIARRGGGPIDPLSPTQAPALPTLTIEGVKLGTPVYMAPEQIRGEQLDGRADQFAWGVLAYELLARKLPWRGGGDALAVMASALTDPVDPLPLERAGVSLAMAQVVVRALEKRPRDRFASMDELRSALESAERGETPVEPTTGAASSTMAQRFSTSEVREVLGTAIERQAATHSSTKLGFEDLIGIAEEVGVDVESLREASRALRIRSEEKGNALARIAQRDAWLRQQRLMFYRHAGIYGIVNAALLVLGLVLLSFTPGWIWFLPALAWGVGVAIHALIAFTSNEQDWIEHTQGMQWWLEDRQRELGAGVSADPMAANLESATRRARIPPASEANKLRSGSGASAAEGLDGED